MPKMQNYLLLQMRKKLGGILAASQWAADSFIHDYGVKRNSVHVVRIGANHMKAFKLSDVNRIISERIQNIRNTLRILFVGVDWERKGGPDFLELCRMLKRNGIHYHADIVGCTPKIPSDLKTDVEVHGFLSKANPVQKRILDALYQHAHFFILPTHAECVGVVFCERGCDKIHPNKKGSAPDHLVRGRAFRVIIFYNEK